MTLQAIMSAMCRLRECADSSIFALNILPSWIRMLPAKLDHLRWTARLLIEFAMAHAVLERLKLGPSKDQLGSVWVF